MFNEVPLFRLIGVKKLVFIGSVLFFGFVSALSQVDAATLEVPGNYPKIQAAIDAAQPGDTVLAAPGDYTESISLKSGVTVQGSGPQVTTLRGDGASDQQSWNTYTVWGVSGGSITGFTITGSHMGIADYSGGSVRIAGNIITGNYVGILIYASSPIIANNIVTANGEMGIGSYYSSPIIINNTITNNSYGEYWGDGIRNSWESAAIISNNIIVGNAQAGIQNLSEALSTISFNNVWNNGTNYSGDTPEILRGFGNMSNDPLFVDASVPDYRLRHGSPCMDAGTNEAPNLSITDFDGKPRTVDGDGNGTAVVDMGAFESETSTVVSAVVKFVPGTLNLGNQGEVLRAYVGPILGYSVTDIDINSLTCEGAVAVETNFSNDKLVAGFNAHELKGITSGRDVRLYVVGKFKDGTVFRGSDTITTR